jgi:hypothetical protein
MRNRRTKDQIQKDKYNSEVDAYNWYVVNLKTQKAETGFEYKEDATELLNDYDDKKQYKVVSKKTLKSMGIEIPNESWKYAKGGVTKNYVPRAELNTVTISRNGKKLTYKISDVLNGAYALKNGGNIKNIAFYVAKRNVVRVQGKTGKQIKPANGYWIKKDAKPIHKMEFGGDFQSGVYGEGGLITETADAIFFPNAKNGKIKTSFGDKTKEGLLNMLTNVNYDRKEIVDAIFDSNEKNGKINTGFGAKTKEGLSEMIKNMQNTFENGGGVEDKKEPFSKEEFIKREIEKQKKIEGTKSFEKFKVNVYEQKDSGGYPFADLKTNNFSEAVSFGKKKMKEQREYNPKSKYLWVSISEFLPIHERNNVIYPYRDMVHFGENDVKDSKFSKGGGVGIEEEIDLTDDKRLRVKELTYEYKKPTAKELAEKHNSGAYEFMEQDKFNYGGNLPSWLRNKQGEMMEKGKYVIIDSQHYNEKLGFSTTIGVYVNGLKVGIVQYDVEEEDYTAMSSKKFNGGVNFPYKEFDNQEDAIKYIVSKANKSTSYKLGGKTTFNDKSNAIAKRFEGKRVEPKYQKEYGKVYSKDEAKEVGNKITGSMVSKEKMMSGGAIERKYNSMSKNNKEELMREKIGVGRTPFSEYEKYSQLSSHHKDLVDKNLGSSKTKQGNKGEAMQLAKKIRKDGEKWTDAVKRAWSQLK